MGRFRKRFEGLQDAVSPDTGGEEAGSVAAEQEGQAGEVGKPKRAFAESDLDWMSEGAVEEKAVKKEVPVAVKGKGKKK